MSTRDGSLPESPRTATWRRSFRRHWPLGCVGIGLVVLGGVSLWTVEMDASRRDLVLGLVVLPGVAAIMLWMRSVMRLRVLLTNGIVTPAIIESRDERALNYAYHDDRGDEHKGRTVGAEAGADGPPLHVVFDPHRPSLHVLACRDDFVEDRLR